MEGSGLSGISRSVFAVLFVVLIAVAALAVLVYMRAGQPQPAPGTTIAQTQQPGAQTTAARARVLVLFDVGGRGDLSFNDMAVMGAERAARDFGVQIDYYTPRSVDDMVPTLQRFSGQYSLILLVGFLWADALNRTADAFPGQKYAIIDAATGVVRNNVLEIVFREQEVAALVGVVAAGVANELGGKAGSVAGMDIPPLWRFQVGFYFGVKYYEKLTGNRTDILWTYTGTFTDPATGKQAAIAMYRQGARIIYGLAGATHIGVFDAARELSASSGTLYLAIGQDASQEWYDPDHIILSGAKRVDVAAYTAIKMAVQGGWRGGVLSLGIAEGGVGLWDLNGVREFAQDAQAVGRLAKGLSVDDVVAKVKSLRDRYISQAVLRIVQDLQQKLASGEIVFRTPATAGERDAIINQVLSGNLNAALAKGSV